MILVIIFLILGFISVIFGTYKLFRNKKLKSHQKGMWLSIFILLPIIGPVIYLLSGGSTDSIFYKLNHDNKFNKPDEKIN